MKSFSIIAAMDENRGIGIRNSMPWHLKGDFKHFVAETTGGTVIMGRNTWESLPAAFKPLKNRKNIVITSQKDYQVPNSVVLAHSLEEALEQSEEKTFVIGGAQLFAEAILHPACQELVVTEVYDQFDCDTFFPQISSEFHMKRTSELLSEKGLEYRFFYYKKT